MSQTSPIIAIAADHAGYDTKAALNDLLIGLGFTVLDLGTDSSKSVDYPDFGDVMGRCITDGKADQGVLICGSGIGISIAANRYPAVRSAVCHDVTTARLARRHNDANVIALGARITGQDVIFDAVRAFLETPFDGGDRHARRVSKLGEINMNEQADI